MNIFLVKYFYGVNLNSCRSYEFGTNKGLVKYFLNGQQTENRKIGTSQLLINNNKLEHVYIIIFTRNITNVLSDEGKRRENSYLSQSSP